MSKATAIVNARVFDGTRLRDWTSVRFADGIISDCAAGPTAHDGDEVTVAEVSFTWYRDEPLELPASDRAGEPAGGRRGRARRGG